MGNPRLDLSDSTSSIRSPCTRPTRLTEVSRGSDTCLTASKNLSSTLASVASATDCPTRNPLPHQTLASFSPSWSVSLPKPAADSFFSLLADSTTIRVHLRFAQSVRRNSRNLRRPRSPVPTCGVPPRRLPRRRRPKPVGTRLASSARTSSCRRKRATRRTPLLRKHQPARSISRVRRERRGARTRRRSGNASSVRAQ